MVQSTISLGGSTKTTPMTTIQAIAIALIAGAARPRFQGARSEVTNSPRRRRRFLKLSQMGTPYAS